MIRSSLVELTFATLGGAAVGNKYIGFSRPVAFSHRTLQLTVQVLALSTSKGKSLDSDYSHR